MVLGILALHAPALRTTHVQKILILVAVLAGLAHAGFSLEKRSLRDMAVPRGLGDHDAIQYGESAASRTTYAVVSLVCMLILATMLGSRATQLQWNELRTLNVTRGLVIILYLLAIMFVFAASVVETGLGLSSPSICRAGILICLAFYVSGKVIMYVFLVERAHAMRAPYMRRTRDWIWLGGMLVVGTGFGSIAIFAFIWPIAELSSKDGRCRIGLPFKVTIPLVVFDVAINMALTGIFIYLLRPLLQFGAMTNTTQSGNRLTKGIGRMLHTPSRPNSEEVYAANQSFFKSVELLLWKTLFGSVLVMLSTLGNLILLMEMRGRELGWLCFTLCTVDVTWGVAVVHWLTTGSTSLDGRAITLLVRPDGARPESGPSATSTVSG